MLSHQDLTSAHTLLRSMYTSLTEVEELTQELAQAVDRGDQVSARMFLSMRQTEIDRLVHDHAALRKQCDHLPAEAGALLWDMVSGIYDGPSPSPEAETLLRQAQQNRSALQRIFHADQAVSRRVAGPDSFYAKSKP